MAIEAVIFDFAQTLVDSADGFRSAEKTAERKLFADLALTDWEEFLVNFRRVRTTFHTAGNFCRVAAWREVYWHYCRDADTSLLQQWETEYWDQVNAQTTPFPETIDVLTELAKQYQLAMITNTEARTTAAKHRVHLFPEIDAFFDVVIAAGSGDAPVKPDPEAFAMCVDRIGLEPQQCVFVGDDWRKDVCGARDAGLRAVWIKHHTIQRNWPDVNVDDIPVITSLHPLLDLPNLLTNN